MQTWRNEESLLHRSGTSSGHSGNFVISFPFPPSALISLFCPLSLHHTDICVPVVEISARLSHSCIRWADTSQLICIYCPCVCMCVFLMRVVKFYLFSSRKSDFILLLQSQWWPKNMDPSLSFNKNVFVQLWDSGEASPVWSGLLLLGSWGPLSQARFSDPVRKNIQAATNSFPFQNSIENRPFGSLVKNSRRSFKIVKHTNTHEQITHKRHFEKVNLYFLIII